MNILTVPPGMPRVSKHVYDWFVKSARGKVIEHANGTAHYVDERMVAVKMGDRYFVRPSLTKR